MAAPRGPGATACLPPRGPRILRHVKHLTDPAVLHGLEAVRDPGDQDRGERLSGQFERLMEDETSPEDLELEEFGLALHGDGGFTVFPEAFEGGTLTVNVGRLPLSTSD